MKRKLIFVCSPYSGDVKENTWIAAEVCKAIHRKTSYLPVAPHLYFPQFLNDNVQSERKAGIEYGLEIMDKCVAVIVVKKDGEMSAGMKKEVEYANEHGKTVLLFDSYHVLLAVASASTHNLEYFINEMLQLHAMINSKDHPCYGCSHNHPHLLVCPCLCEKPNMAKKHNDFLLPLMISAQIFDKMNISSDAIENSFFKKGI